MNDSNLIHVFFYIAGTAVILVALLCAIVIIYFIKILHDIRYLVTKARNEADLLGEDLSEFRSKVRANGWKFGYLIAFLTGLYRKHKN